MTPLQLVILEAFGYVTLMLILFKTTYEDFRKHIKAILIYAPIYIAIGVMVLYGVNGIIVLVLSYVSVVVFIKKAFVKKISKCLLLALGVTFFSWIVLQMLSIIILGFVLSSTIGYNFADGIIVVLLTLIFAKLSFLFVPLDLIADKLIETEKYFHFIAAFLLAIALLYLLSSSIYFEQLHDQHLAFTFFLISSGLASVLAVTYYYTINFVYELKEKSTASKKFDELKKHPIKSITDLAGCEKHLNIVYHLSHLQDETKINWYIKNYLNNFEDDSKAKLSKVNDKILAAYLYLKIKHLQHLGIECVVENRHYEVKAKIKTSKLLKAIDLVIEEILMTTPKEESDLMIVLGKTDDGNKQVVDVYKKSERKFMCGEIGLFKNMNEEKHLRNLKAINEEMNCRVYIEDIKFDNGYYFRLRYLML